ncbi:MAG: HEAT repeat domain-containing protein [Planctomycetota bacterium]|jgi:HEAT repeat protein
MKLSLPLKLGICVILLFGAVIAACLLWTPLRFSYYRNKLVSDDPAGQVAARKFILERKKKALPYVRSWLATGDNRLLSAAMDLLDEMGENAWYDAKPHVKDWLTSGDGTRIMLACRTLYRMEGNTWQFALPEIETALSGRPTRGTDAAAWLLMEKGEMFVYRGRMTLWKRIEKNESAKRNFCIYVFRDGKKGNENFAATYLRGIKDPLAVGALLDALANDSNSDTRRYAAYALQVFIDRPEVYERMAKTARNDESISVRSWAMAAFTKPRSIPLLKEAFKKDPGLREQVIPLLARMRRPEATDILVRAQRDPAYRNDWYCLSYSLDDTYSRRAIEPLLQTLEDESAGNVRTAARSLGEMLAESAAPRMLGVLEKTDDEKVQSALIRVLGGFGYTEAVPPIIGIMKTTRNENVFEECVKALGEIGDRRAAEPLLEMLKNPKVNWKGGIYASLIRLGDERIVDVLIEALQNNRSEEFTILGLLGECGNAKAQEKIMERFRAKKTHLGNQWSVLNAIRKIGGPAAREFFRSLIVEEKDIETVHSATYHLRTLAQPGDAELLLPFLEKTYDWQPQASLIRTLAATGNSAVIPTLMEQLGSEYTVVTATALDALGSLDTAGNEAIVSAVKERLESEHDIIRIAAVRALGRLRGADAVGPVAEVLRREKKEYVIGIIADVLDEIGTDEAVAVLFEGLDMAPYTHRNQVTWAGDFAFKLAALESGRFFRVLNNCRIKKTPDVLLLCAMHGEDVGKERLAALDLKGSRLEDLREFHFALTGDLEALGRLFYYFESDDRFARWPYYRKLHAIMPDGIPPLYEGGERGLREKQDRRIKNWYYDNRERLAWDAEKCRYFLRETPENENRDAGK